MIYYLINLQSIIKFEKYKNFTGYRSMIYKLLPPNDERVLSSIAPFDIETFKKNEKDLTITDFVTTCLKQ